MTCLDPRCVPENFFGPNFQGPVFRNAGGRATDDAIRSFALLRGLADMKTVVVIHHTGTLAPTQVLRCCLGSDTERASLDCGMMHVTSEEIVGKIGENGAAAKAAAAKIDWGLFSSNEFEQSIKDDVRVLKRAPALKGMNVYGFKLDTFTGKVEPVME